MILDRGPAQAGVVLNANSSLYSGPDVSTSLRFAPGGQAQGDKDWIPAFAGMTEGEQE